MAYPGAVMSRVCTWTVVAVAVPCVVGGCCATPAQYEYGTEKTEVLRTFEGAKGRVDVIAVGHSVHRRSTPGGLDFGEYGPYWREGYSANDSYTAVISYRIEGRLPDDPVNRRTNKHGLRAGVITENTKAEVELKLKALEVDACWNRDRTLLAARVDSPNGTPKWSGLRQFFDFTQAEPRSNHTFAWTMCPDVLDNPTMMKWVAWPKTAPP